MMMSRGEGGGGGKEEEDEATGKAFLSGCVVVLLTRCSQLSIVRFPKDF